MMDKVYPVWKEGGGSDHFGLEEVFSSAEEAVKYKNIIEHWAEAGAFYAGENYAVPVFKTAEEAIKANHLQGVRPVLVFCEEPDVNNLNYYNYDVSTVTNGQELNKVEFEWQNYFVTVLDLGSKEATLEYAQKLIKEYIDVHTY
jgi:hypothetical protein